MKQQLLQTYFLSFFKIQIFRLIGFSLLMFFSIQSFAQMGIDFDGSGDHVETGGGAEPDHVTVEAWVKPESFSNYEGIATNWEWTGSNRSGYALHVFADGSIHGWVGFGSTHETVSGGSLPTGSWSHVAMTFDGTNIKIFLDGTELATKTVNTPQAINYTHIDEGFHIGNAKDSDRNYYFDGMIDEVRVWDYARTETEIAGDKDNELCGDESGLVGYYQMNCGDKPGEDKTGNADGTLVGGATSLVGRTLAAASCGTIVCNNGNRIWLRSQAEVDSFSIVYGCDCNQTGELLIGHISNNGINDISELSRITSITGNLSISALDMTNIPFDSLTSIGGSLKFQYNNSLTSTGDFGNLTSIGGYISIAGNDALISTGSFGNLTSIGNITIHENNALTSISGFGNLTSIGSWLSIRENTSLTSIGDFGNLTSIGGGLTIRENTSLISTGDFGNLTSIGGGLTIRENTSLISTGDFGNLTSIGGELSFDNNSSLTSTGDFGNLTSIGVDLYINDNDALTSTGDFGNLTSIGGDLSFDDNDDLTSTGDFGNLTSIGGGIEIHQNSNLTSIGNFGNSFSIGATLSIQANGSLTDISGLSFDPTSLNELMILFNSSLMVCESPGICDYLDDQNNSATIFWNATGCASRTEVETECAAVLPVELVTFTAQKADENVRLFWQTASEINNEGFEIWHSRTGNDDWEVLDFIAGKGNTVEQQSYRFEHTNPSGGVHYYRLKQMDFDGVFEFSKTISIELEGGNAEMFFRPNPGHSGSEISLNLKIEDFETGELRLFDLNGKTVLNQKVTGSSTTLNVKNLAEGIYYAELISGRQRMFEKLLIQK